MTKSVSSSIRRCTVMVGRQIDRWISGWLAGIGPWAAIRSMMRFGIAALLAQTACDGVAVTDNVTQRPSINTSRSSEPFSV
ncbi:hypothetical protein WK34_10150 [Burkholderia vietnamiensis]|nr:hypothetical protein WK34_10150 [Burkholderia vietnamiensis]